MRNARATNTMGGSEKKVIENTYNISSQKRAGSFTLRSCKTTAKKCTKKCAARAKLLFR